MMEMQQTTENCKFSAVQAASVKRETLSIFPDEDFSSQWLKSW